MEEWTKADTGVGAAIAAGSQAEKGIWALLVKLASTRASARGKLALSRLSRALQAPLRLRVATPTTTPTSPTRLLRAGSKAALEDLVLL